jgi:hypothetical protein
MGKNKVKEFYIVKMEIDILETGSLTTLMVKGYMLSVQGKFTKVH